MAYSSWSFHPAGAKKSRTHMSVSMAAKSMGSAISVNMMTKKSMPTLSIVVSIPDSVTGRKTCQFGSNAGVCSVWFDS